MSKLQLIKTRDELRTALSRVQAMIDTILEGEREVAREKSKQRAAKRAATPNRTPSKDPRVAAIRAVVTEHLGGVQVYNGLRKDGTRRIKVWYPLSTDRIEKLRIAINIAIAGVTEVSYHTVPYGVGRGHGGRCLCVVIPAQK